MASEQTITRAEALALVNERTRALRLKADTVTPEERAAWLEHHDNLPRYAHVADDRHRFLLRYPRLAAHLICASLGYFCPNSAAIAIARYQANAPFFCEWYAHMSQGYDHAKMIDVGRYTMQRAITDRRHHTGYMAEYLQARQVILRELAGHGPELASWF